MRTLKPKQILEKMATNAYYEKYGEVRPEYRINKQFKGLNKANGLTKAIIAYIKLTGGQAERVSVEGRVIDQRQTYTDVLGHKRQIGSIKRIKSSMTRGSADISATIGGRSVKIEVKIGTDRQSDAQKQYQADVERAGGVYYIARTFDEFYEWHREFTGQTPANE